MALRVELVSPERILFTGDAEMVICRTIGGGDIAFLTGHAPFLGALDIWPVRIKLAGKSSCSGAWMVLVLGRESFLPECYRVR